MISKILILTLAILAIATAMPPVQQGSSDHSGHDHSDHDHSGHDHSGNDHSGHDHSGHDHSGHDHSTHDHAGHDHSTHDHAGHDHSTHDHAGHDHSTHDHSGHDHAGHNHGPVGASRGVRSAQEHNPGQGSYGKFQGQQKVVSVLGGIQHVPEGHGGSSGHQGGYQQHGY